MKSYFNLINEKVREHLIKFLLSLPLGKYEIIIQEKKRSNAQNRFYRGPVLDALSNWNGDSKDDWHELLKVRFLGTYEKEVDGKTLVYPKSTTKLTTKEFNNFLMMVEALALTLGVTLPTPEHHGVER